MSDILGNTLAFVFALGLIIFVHEGGHLIVAKLFNIRAVTFSLGFGKRLWGFRRGETEYQISLIPLGGYVQLSGEDPAEVSDDPREFLNRPRWERVLVYLAGPAMNVVLAVLLVAVVFMMGIEVPAPPRLPPVVGAVAPDSPAEAAGLVPGDRIVEIAGKEISEWAEVRFELMTAPERALPVRYRRGERLLETTITPAKVPRYEFGDAGVFPEMMPSIGGLFPGDPAEQAGFEVGDEVRRVDGRSVGSRGDFVDHIAAHPGEPVEVEVLRRAQPVILTVIPREKDGRGWIGVSLSSGSFQRYGPVKALVESVRFNAAVTVQTFSVLGRIVTGRLAAKSALAGPIQIAALSGAAARSGLNNLLHLMGLISISIAILNLLPIPVLDGGQIFILLIESVSRRDLSLRLKERINQVGFVMIVMLMVVVLYFDLVKSIPAGLLPGS